MANSITTTSPTDIRIRTQLNKVKQMNRFLNTVKHLMRSFAKDEDGSQVIEYALIIAVVSIALVVALQALTGTTFSGFITRVSNCLSTPTCT
jgi:pilus assembly protein Flp/PilA